MDKYLSVVKQEQFDKKSCVYDATVQSIISIKGL